METINKDIQLLVVIGKTTCAHTHTHTSNHISCNKIIEISWKLVEMLRLLTHHSGLFGGMDDWRIDGCFLSICFSCCDETMHLNSMTEKESFANRDKRTKDLTNYICTLHLSHSITLSLSVSFILKITTIGAILIAF